ncbi:MAG: PHP domain-containing protein [Candidatus Helarchaeales archaeon]
MLVDPHVHLYSPCSRWTLKQLVREADLKELDVVIITDHDVISKIPHDIGGNTKFLSGTEITTKEGHVLAYGTTEEIKTHSISQAMDEIHEQGGVAVAAHPFRHFKQEESPSPSCSLKEKIHQLNFDAIETINGLNTAKENELARRHARSLSLPEIGGSDAHGEGELGTAITITQIEIENIDDFIKAIKKRLVKPRFIGYK